MRLGIVSDLHLGFSDDALEQAREALFKAAERSDVLLLPGDLFDARVPRQEVVHDAVKLFAALQLDSGVKLSAIDGDGKPALLEGYPPFVAIYGTHERRTKGLSNLVQIFHAAKLLVNCHAQKILVEKNGERVVIQGMGGVPEEYAASVLASLAPKPVEGAFNVFMFHQTLRELIPQDEDALASQDLPEGFDLYVDGHLHWRVDETFDGKNVVIPGSTVITQMREKEQEPKGFDVYDTATKQLEFNAIHSRPFAYKEIVFDEAGAADVSLRVRRILDEALAEKGRVAKPLIKLKLRGTLKPGLKSGDIDLSDLVAEYANKVAQLSVDKEFEGASLADKIAELRQLREEKMGAKELGFEVLRASLEQKNWKLCDPEKLFSLLSEGDVDAALELVNAAKPLGSTTAVN